MLAVRVALSNPEKAAERQSNLEDHKRHLRSGRLRIVQSGPILNEHGEGSGGVVVADVVSLEEMRRFSAEDPFVLHEVYSSVSIYEWRLTIGDRG
ncbi:YciI family protein [Rhizobium sp. RAF56]|uniref:YciI family protein n=1 Tax=Rhizobium sp. RAF56 TaxID=3233062 RepID=UPI003F98EE49